MAATLVGGAFLSSFLNVLVDRIASNEFINYFKCQKLNEGYLRKLRTVLRSVNKLLGDAEVKQIDDETVREWLDELKDAFYEADDLLDEIVYEARWAELNADSQDASIGTMGRILASVNFSSEKPDFVVRIEKALEKFKDLLDQKNELGLTEGTEHRPLLQFERRTTSLVDESRVYGREADKEVIIRQLISKEGESRSGEGLKVISIMGMGGVGKTTLAQLVYNDDEVKAWFCLQAWVYVAEEFDTFKVTRNILKELAPENMNKIDGFTENQLHTELKKKLNGQRFLLVLDDIWDDSRRKWDILMMPLRYGGKGSRIIVTTRIEAVASIVSSNPPHHLELLSDSHCWSLFAQRAFESEIPSGYPDLAEIGQKIAGKCKGLPLAANALGCLLMKERDARVWKKILESDIWDKKNDDILPALRLSYNYLPSNLKRCFAYCAIIPKDYQFTEEKLILLWMAEGLLDSRDEKLEIEDIGQESFNGLVARSFFQRLGDNSCFIMHDLINDLAKSIAGDFCFRAEGNKFPSKAAARIHHLSYERKYYVDCEEFACNICEAQSLRTLLPNDFFGQSKSYDRGINQEVLQGLLSLKRLRVLNLSEYININELPDSIGRMKHLRYLDLSGTGISRLPDVIKNACNLQTLNLENCYKLMELPDSIVALKCLHYLNFGATGINKLPMMSQFCRLKTLILSNCSKLVKLPNDITGLINLCHLDLRKTRLQQMPRQFGNLTKLQTLTDFYVDKQVGHSIKELQKLYNLQGDFKIWNLQNVIYVHDAMEASLKDKKHLERLELIWEGDANDSLHEKNVLERLEPHTGLQHLSIVGYGGTTFPDWVGHSSFMKMVSLTLNGCKTCYELPPLGQLQFLKELRINNFDILVYVGPNFYGDWSCATKAPFELLEILEFRGMSGWENTEGAFPQLKNLSIINCPKLIVNLPIQLPCLEMLYIEGCTKINAPYPRSPVLQYLRLSDNYCNLFQERGSGGQWVFRVTWAESLDTMLGGIVQMGAINSRIVGLNCSNVESLPQYIDKYLPSLVDLELRDCPKLESFLEGSLPPKLESLMISGCNGLIGNRTKWHLQLLPSLSHLEIDEFDSDREKAYKGEMECFPEEMLLPSTLTSLKIMSLENLEYLQCNGIQHLSFLQKLEICYCPQLKILPLEYLSSLQNLNIFCCPQLEEVPLQHLSSLQKLEIFDCFQLKRLTLQNVSSLQKLMISNCPQLKILSFEGLLLATLTFLQIRYLDNLTSLEGIHYLASLQTLIILGCHQLQSLPEEGLPHSLTYLGISEMKFLKSIANSLKQLTSLQTLAIGDCPMLKLVPEDGLPSTITSFEMWGFGSLKSLNYKGLQHLTCLEKLTIYNCRELQSVTEDALPSSLIHLHIRDLEKMVSMDHKGFEHLHNLTQLEIFECPKLQSLSEEGLLPSFSPLQYLILRMWFLWTTRGFNTSTISLN